MKFKEYSFYFYVCSILIVLFNLFVFPDLFNKDFNFNDTHDSGHSKYIETILSDNHNTSLISGLSIVNESNITNIMTLKEIINTSSTGDNKKPIYFHNKRLHIKCYDECGGNCNKINSTEEELINCFYNCDCEVSRKSNIVKDFFFYFIIFLILIIAILIYDNIWEKKKKNSEHTECGYVILKEVSGK